MHCQTPFEASRICSRHGDLVPWRENDPPRPLKEWRGAHDATKRKLGGCAPDTDVEGKLINPAALMASSSHGSGSQSTAQARGLQAMH